MDKNKLIKENRKAIKPQWTDLRNIKTDRQLNLERPELFKELNSNTLVGLTNEFPNVKNISLTDAIKNRRSLRKYSNIPLSFEEVSYLLWETSRVDHVKGNVVFRTIPTGGATNSMETYVYINNVEGIDKGLYHYIQNKHTLELLENNDDLETRVNDSLLHQLRGASIIVYFTAVPYRSEYKYAFTAHKMIMIEAGHAGQNLSLACESINSGAVCIAAYDQILCDTLLELDGEEEFTTYVLAIGKKE